MTAPAMEWRVTLVFADTGAGCRTFYASPEIAAKIRAGGVGGESGAEQRIAVAEVIRIEPVMAEGADQGGYLVYFDHGCVRRWIPDSRVLYAEYVDTPEDAGTEGAG